MGNADATGSVAETDVDIIKFDSSLAGGTITLAGSAITISDSLTIDGLGATQLTISGNSQSQIFVVNDGNKATNINVTMDGLTLTKGAGAAYRRRHPSRRRT